MDEDAVPRDIAALGKEMGERFARLETYLIGIDGKNGLRGEVGKIHIHLARQDEILEEQGKAIAESMRRQQEYFDRVRRDTCFGLEVFGEHKAEHEEAAQAAEGRKEKAADRALEDRKSRRQMLAAVLAAMVGGSAMTMAVDRLLPRSAPAPAGGGRVAPLPAPGAAP